MMNSNPIKPKSAPLPPLYATRMAGSTLVYFDSLLRAVGIDPATEPSDRPLTISVKDAARRIGKSERTIFRMIEAGREAVAA